MSRHSTPLGQSDRAGSAMASSSSQPGGKVKKKRPAAQMLYNIVLLQEFLKEMAAIAQEQCLAHYDMIK